MRWCNMTLSWSKVYFQQNKNNQTTSLQIHWIQKDIMDKLSHHLFLKLTHYLLTPWCRVLLEKLSDLQLVKKFPALYGTRRFITAFTSFRHPSLSWASPIQSPYPQPTSSGWQKYDHPRTFTKYDLNSLRKKHVCYIRSQGVPRSKHSPFRL